MKKFLILTLASALLVSGNAALAKPFSDVSINHENYVAIESLKYLKKINGYSDGTYRPAAVINRAEFTKIIVETFFTPEKIDNCTDVKFKDIKSDDWFVKYVCLAEKEGLIDGYADGTFRPANNINTAEAYKIVMTLAISLEEEETVKVTGTAGEWYEIYINYAYSNAYNHNEYIDVAKEFTRGAMAQLIYLTNNGIFTKLVKPGPFYGYFDVYHESYLDIPAKNGFLVLFFSKDNCEECEESEGIIIQNLQLIPKHLAIVKVSENEELIEKYDIESFPTYVQIDESGKVLAKWNEGSLGTIAAIAPYAYEED